MPNNLQIIELNIDPKRLDQEKPEKDPYIAYRGSSAYIAGILKIIVQAGYGVGKPRRSGIIWASLQHCLQYFYSAPHNYTSTPPPTLLIIYTNIKNTMRSTRTGISDILGILEQYFFLNVSKIL
uniref:Uncharacterized protein n=1 Tax=Meloidogyne enterolobii TaxID=390850 RepID=A0A6V7YAF0_MELEN|nr:unnamed protein product [Meloidogyne enterolobii]